MIKYFLQSYSVTFGDENYPSLLEGLFFCGDERSDVSPKHAKQFRAAEKAARKQGHGQAAVERNSMTSEMCKKETSFIVLFDETGLCPLQTLRETNSHQFLNFDF